MTEGQSSALDVQEPNVQDFGGHGKGRVSVREVFTWGVGGQSGYCENRTYDAPSQQSLRLASCFPSCREEGRHTETRERVSAGAPDAWSSTFGHAALPC